MPRYAPVTPLVHVHATTGSVPKQPTRARFSPRTDAVAKRSRTVDIVTALAVGLLAAGVVAAGVWLVAAPPAGGVHRPASLFKSFVPSETYPLLDRARERCFLGLVAALPVGALIIAALVYRTIRRSSGTIVTWVLVAAEILLAAVALGALCRNPTFGGFGRVLGWGPFRVVIGAAVACGLMVGADRATALSPAAIRFVRVLAWAAVVVAGAPLIISSFETASTVKDVGDTGWVLNELLAPAAGSRPLVDYATSYSNLLGYPLAAGIRLGADPLAAGVLLIVTLCAATLTGTWLLLRQVMSRTGAAMGTLLVVAVAKTSRARFEFPTADGPVSLHYDMFSYHQIMPLRMAGPILVGWLVVRRRGSPAAPVLIGSDSRPVPSP